MWSAPYQRESLWVKPCSRSFSSACRINYGSNEPLPNTGAIVIEYLERAVSRLVGLTAGAVGFTLTTCI